jgi:hypothetical protein
MIEGELVSYIHKERRPCQYEDFNLLYAHYVHLRCTPAKQPLDEIRF